MIVAIDLLTKLLSRQMGLAKAQGYVIEDI
jgi:hypothetical protein